MMVPSRLPNNSLSAVLGTVPALPVALAVGWASGAVAADAGAGPAGSWRLGAPIVTYWAGPPMTEATARQMSEGNWNLVWCREAELDMAQRFGLRAYLHDGLLRPESLDDPGVKAKLEALIGRVRNHPALYCYHLQDEPNAAAFPALARLVAYLREQDPAHLAYINLFPTYASNEQLGNQGDTTTAYTEHLRQFVATVKPGLVSYDHYHFGVDGDGGQYFLNLGLIRQTALAAGLPFLNIVQACSWTPNMRVPTGDELRWLVYTSLAYGAQGISYYVYCHPGHEGAMANADGTPTVLYGAATVLNREFAAIAAELQPLVSRGAYHAGMVPPGAVPLPAAAEFRLEPTPVLGEYQPQKPVQGFVLGYFGKREAPGQATGPSHVLVVNLDYQRATSAVLVGPAPLVLFDQATRSWSPAGASRAELQLPPGGGRLVRIGQ
jgi:hypothetical protein